MIAVINYGMGNLRSVAKALELSGEKVEVSGEKELIRKADSLVLPGVGSFPRGMRNLRALGLAPVIRQAMEEGKPFLGICLGMQLLLEKSEEGEECQGLGVIKGRVRRFGAGLRVPHTGWNSVSIRGDSPVFRGIPDGSHFYFVHSYFVVPEDPGLISSSTFYGGGFASSLAKGNIFATQFHPEKSHGKGILLLDNFCKLKKE